MYYLKINSVLLASLLLATAALSAAPEPALDAELRIAIEQMRQARLGPFESVRWFCADGRILPPEPYACRPYGGGRQHGKRSVAAERVRATGIPLGNVIAELSPGLALAEHGRLLKALLVEQYLMATRDGWIFHKARFVRGALQSEDEVAAATRLVAALAEPQNAFGDGFLLLRESMRRLPYGGRVVGLDRVRALASLAAERDAGFASLRNKIHSRPDAQDAALVMAFLAKSPNSPAKSQLEQLATAIDTVYVETSAPQALDRFAQDLQNPKYRDYAQDLRTAASPAAELRLLGEIMQRLRERHEALGPANRLRAMALSLELEEAAFRAARQHSAGLASQTRRDRLLSLATLGQLLYGSGLLSTRERSELDAAVTRLLHTTPLRLVEYRSGLAILARIPVWAAQRLHFHLGEMAQTFARADPASLGLIPDRLRASAALSYGEFLESLSADADSLAGIRHDLFGQAVATGLRALNPGLARGELSRLSGAEPLTQTRGIVLVPESIADLPPVAGILTAAEGNALSHVQLLARNLGVPNVVIGERWIPHAEQRLGQPVVLAASPGGVVRLAEDGPAWDTVFPQQVERAVEIHVDLAKLDLRATGPLPLDMLRATDSGRIVGPKAAKLGELHARFPSQVSAGLAIPFGSLRALLDRPMAGTDGSTFEWMKANYTRLRALPDGPQRTSATGEFLHKLRAWIESAPPTPGFRAKLAQAMQQQFGEDGSYGVFVRSDTNVEDLPGFTGAGLNLTVPNVVGFENILQAIHQVWASPFSERAFGWRQALMDQPEHVYAAVLLHKTIPAELSGVMITSDLNSGDPGFVTLAVNEGVGGGVEGQAAESLRIALDGRSVELLASATEPRRRVVRPDGGTRLEPASGAERLLSAGQIEKLLEVARALPQKYPQQLDAQGRVAPADVEFAFAADTLFLNQIRPFLQSDRARRNGFLLSLDSGLAESAHRLVDLEGRP